MMGIKSLEEIQTMCAQKIRKISGIRADLNLKNPDDDTEISYRLKDDQYYQNLRNDLQKLTNIYYRELYGKEKIA